MNLLIIALSFILAIIVRYHQMYLLLILILPLFGLIIYKRKYKTLVSSVLFLLIGFFLTSYSLRGESSNVSVEGDFRVVEVGQNYQLVKRQSHKFLVYIDAEFEIDDQIYIEGRREEITTFNIPHLSTFKDYLRTKGVFFEIGVQKYVKHNNFNLRYKIKQLAYANISPISRNFIRLLIFADKSENYDLYQELKTLSIVQLFVISGFHFNILFSILQKIFFKKTPFTIGILIFYIYILNFPIPALRAVVMMILDFINTRYLKSRLTGFQNIIVTMIIILLLFPLSLFSLSFQLTFLATYALRLIGQKRNKIAQLFYSSILIYIFMMPLLINVNFEINVLSFLFNLLMTIPVSILYIMSLLTIFVKFTDVFLIPIILSFHAIIAVLLNINLIIIVGWLSLQIITLYYLILILFCYARSIRHEQITKLSILAYCLLFAFIYFDKSIYSSFSLSFIDVGQGDSILLHGKNNSFNILIDTGGSQFTDIGTRRIIPYLKSLGVESLDAIIITHSDYDHDGALESIETNFNVKKIYREEFVVYKNKNLHVQNLNTYNDLTKDENYNSHVLLVKYEQYSFLLTGDAPQEIEEKIINDYTLPPIDVLKIGHHGSNTSTSDQFLRVVQPKFIAVCVGYHNRYHHPHEEVMWRIKQHNIPYLRTDLNGTIVIKKRNIITDSVKKIPQIIYNIFTGWK